MFPGGLGVAPVEEAGEDMVKHSNVSYVVNKNKGATVARNLEVICVSDAQCELAANEKSWTGKDFRGLE